MDTILTFPTTAGLPAMPWQLSDPDHGILMVMGTPESSPHIWRQYVDGAFRSYSSRGVEVALEYDAVLDGSSTMVFCAVLDDAGVVVGGVRAQGPYVGAGESHALIEWDGQDGYTQVADAINARCRDGIIEVKTAFVEPESPAAAEVAGLLARAPLALMTATGCRYMMATAADYVLARWESGGGRVNREIPATPYPDERYQTRVMFWDWYTLSEHARPGVWDRMQAEYAVLCGGVEPGQQRVSMLTA